MKFENSLADVTVLILSHNRHNCLLPALEYWNDLGMKTLVIDESDISFRNADKFAFVSYHHIQKNFAERCRIASILLKTKYAIVVSDDELYTPSGLLKMKEALDADPKLVSVGGVALAIWKYGPRVAGAWPYRGTFGYENDSNTPLSRIRFHTGNGKKTHSAFFTSNLNRTEHLKRCLDLYSKAPVIATEAISILTICAAGKSKYLRELFWIRNWNEFPKSHANWDRGLYLHDWWRREKGTIRWSKFRTELQQSFSEFSDLSQFDEIWDMILSANEAAQPSINTQGYKSKDWLDTYQARYIKFFSKKMMKSRNIPMKYERILEEMILSEVHFNAREVDRAVNIVKRMKPYKNWK